MGWFSKGSFYLPGSINSPILGDKLIPPWMTELLIKWVYEIPTEWGWFSHPLNGNNGHYMWPTQTSCTTTPTNINISLKKRPFGKTWIIFQPLILRGYVSLRESNFKGKSHPKWPATFASRLIPPLKMGGNEPDMTKPRNDFLSYQGWKAGPQRIPILIPQVACNDP